MGPRGLERLINKMVFGKDEYNGKMFSVVISGMPIVGYIYINKEDWQVLLCQNVINECRQRRFGMKYSFDMSDYVQVMKDFKILDREINPTVPHRRVTYKVKHIHNNSVRVRFYKGFVVAEESNIIKNDDVRLVGSWLKTPTKTKSKRIEKAVGYFPSDMDNDGYLPDDLFKIGCTTIRKNHLLNAIKNLKD